MRFCRLTALLACFILLSHANDVSAQNASTGQETIPRIEDAIISLDGRLDEDVWSRAKVFSGFYAYRPFDDRPAQDSTTVYVWYSPTAIHFGIRAYSQNGEVRATLADRDKIQGDDYIQILLDNFNCKCAKQCEYY